MSKEATQPSNPNRIGIVGAGIAGVTSALKLADAGYFVDLFEATAELLNETSDATPCRLNLGFHYMDYDTAKLMLMTSIELVRYLKETTGQDFTVRSAAREDFNSRIYYAISKNSLVDLSKTKEIFGRLSALYAELCQKDTRNEVFGAPNKFYYEVAIDEIKETLKTDDIACVFSTCETLFDWPAFKIHLIDKINQHPNIKVHKNCFVTSVQRAGSQFTITPKEGVSYKADVVVNCAWQNADRLAMTYDGGQILQESKSESIITNRVKCMAIIKPKKPIQHSVLVGYGAFAAISVRPDGLVYLTWEPATNMEQFSSSLLSDAAREEKLLHGLPEQEKTALAQKIINGASAYFPGLQEGEILGLRIGIVRTDGPRVDIRKIDRHYQRLSLGVKMDGPAGIITNEARKHTYWCRNAEMTIRLVKEYLLLREAKKNLSFFSASVLDEKPSAKKLSNIQKISYSS